MGPHTDKRLTGYVRQSGVGVERAKDPIWTACMCVHVHVQVCDLLQHHGSGRGGVSADTVGLSVSHFCQGQPLDYSLPRPNMGLVAND